MVQSTTLVVALSVLETTVDVIWNNNGLSQKRKWNESDNWWQWQRTLSAQKAASCCWLARWLGLRRIQAQTSSPSRWSGTPTTCTSATASWPCSTSSTSRGYTFSPPRINMSCNNNNNNSNNNDERLFVSTVAHFN